MENISHKSTQVQLMSARTPALRKSRGYKRAFSAPLRLCVSFLFLLFIAHTAIAADDKPSPESEAFFESKVRPLLVAKCFECHGEKQQKGDLRLDSRDAVFKGNDGGPAVVPGKPDDSRLIEVIGYRDPVRMPPKGKLSDAEIETLMTWVKLGAPFPGSATSQPAAPPLGSSATPEGVAQARATHWAYQPIRKPVPPAIKNAAWVSSPIDGFVLSKLEANNMLPAPHADRRTLLRRATFDLIGLPPTIEEVTAFENDNSPDSFAKVIDRLLASPHYGERWGRHWLDVARYADTKGYVFTEERKYPYSYTYRDYVIRAFNNDLPFDRFILEQLAADQLPLGNDKLPLAAMGFLTVGRRFGNNQNDIIDDRIDVVSRGLLGLTLTCARCHDHKFDPLPTADYYSLHGVFASSVEPADLPQIAPAVENDAYREFQKELAKREKEVADFASGKHAALLDELRSKVSDYLVAVVRKNGNEKLPTGIGLSISPGEVRPSMVSRWQDYLRGTAEKHHPVFAPWHEFAKLPAEGFEEKAAAIVAGLSTASTAGDGSHFNPLVKQALIVTPPKSMVDVAAVYGKLLNDTHQQWLKVTNETKESEKTTTTAGSSNPANAPSKVSASTLSDPAAEELRQVLYGEKSPTVFTTEESRKLRLFDRATSDKIRNLQKNVDSFKANSPVAPPRAMVMNDTANPTQPRIFIRGNQGRPGPQVPRQFLQVLSETDRKPFSTGSGRLELAQAIASPHNPLTARVIVNRIWLHHFGDGLVRTPSDFGVRGEPPTHPELLDWLAATFIEDGWSLKKLHKRILMSSVYQQASLDRADYEKLDPDNRLLWKMNRARLEFEPLRDAILAVAGRLDRTLEGRPVDLLAQPFTTRRTVYGFIDRQDLPSLFRVFDFASPDVSMPQRPETTVPQQALFALNSPFVIEQVKHLAARLEVTSVADTDARIQSLYRLIYARAATVDEVRIGRRFLEQTATNSSLTTLEQYTQALLLANEFVFVD